jgi:zinc protease
MHNRGLGTLSYCLFVLCVGHARAQQSGAQLKEARPDDRKARLFAGAAAVDATGVRSYLVRQPGELAVVLNSGLTLLIKEHRSAPVAAVRMYVKTGSIYEQEYLGTGISHLFEHLLHGGSTSTRSESEAEKIIISIGNNSNAYTTTDHTCYFINTSREHAATAVDLLADFITNPIWPDKEFEREWQVVQRELEMNDNEPQRQLYYAQMEALYTVHPARFRTIGYQSAIQTLTKADIVGYYERMYVPDNVVVSVAGDFQAEEILALLQKAFSRFTRRPVRTVAIPPEPPVGSPRTVVRNLPTTRELLFSLNYPTVELTHPDLYALDLLAFILGTGDSSRMAVAIRDKQLGRSIGCNSFTPNWGSGTFEVDGRTMPDKWEVCKAAILAEIKRVAAEPVSADELAKAKRLKTAEHVFSHQTAESVASSLGTSFLSAGDPHFDDYYTKRIQEVTAEQILAVARRYLVDERLCSAFVGPPGFVIGKKAGEQEQAARSGMEIKKLDNGMRILLKRDPYAPVVALQFFLKGGQVGETAGQAGLHAMLGQLLPRGTKTRSAQEIASFFDSAGGDISASGQRHTLGVSCQVLKEDFDRAFDVFADVIVNPTFPEDQLAIFKPIMLAAIRAIPEQIDQYTFDVLASRFHPASPYGHRRLGTIETVGNMTADMLRSFYHDRLCGKESVLAIVGDVDMDAAMAKVKAAFGSVPADPRQTLPKAATDPPLQENTVHIAKSDQAAAMIMLAYRGVTLHDDADLTNLAVIDTIISGYGYPSGWLHTDLRGGVEGLTYAVHAFNSPGVVPFMFAAYANCQPKNAGRVFEIMTRDLAKAARGEFTEAELAEAKNQILVNEKMSNQTAAEVAMQAAANVVLDRDYDWDSPDKLAARLNAVALDTIKATARKYLTQYTAVITTPAPETIKLEGVKVVHVKGPTTQAAADK